MTERTPVRAGSFINPSIHRGGCVSEKEGATVLTVSSGEKPLKRLAVIKRFELPLDKSRG